MKNVTIAIVLFLCSLFLVSICYAQSTDDNAWTQPPAWTGQRPSTVGRIPNVKECAAGTEPTGWNTEVSSLIGYRVWNGLDFYVGQITDLVIDQTNGRIALLLLSDVPGFGAKLVAIPYGSLTKTAEGILEMAFPSRMGPYSLDAVPNAYVNAMAPGVVPSTIDADWVALVYQNYGQVPYWTEAPQAMDLYRSSKVIGADVRSPNGEVEAKIDDLTVNTSDGHIVLVSLSDVAGGGDNLVAVPFSLLTRTEENVFALNITGAKLAEAPSFKESDMENPVYSANVYKLFGQTPCWTEGTN